jgi:hypothetical protein
LPPFTSQQHARQAGRDERDRPTKGAGPFATYYLLHGMSDDYTIWRAPHAYRVGIVRDLP